MTVVDVRDETGSVSAASIVGGISVSFSANLSLIVTEDQATALGSVLGGGAMPSTDKTFKGLMPANNGNSGLTISPGQIGGVALPIGISKTTAAWSAGDGGGLIDIGAIQPNKGYHLFLIVNESTGAKDILASISAHHPALPSGFTKVGRFNAFVTDAAGNVQQGIWYSTGEFRLATAYRAVNGAPGNFLTLAPLIVPVGVKIMVKGQVFGASGGVAFWIIVRDPDLGTIPDVPEQWYESQVYIQAGSNDGGPFESWTDTSGQIYHVAYPRSASHLIYVYFQGWVYPQGDAE